MVPRPDLNLVPQRDHYDDETVAEAAEKVTPEHRPVPTPAGIDDEEAILPFRTSTRLQGIMYRVIQQERLYRGFDLNLVPQRDHYDDKTVAKVAEEKVTPEQNPVPIPAGVDDDDAILPFRTSTRLQGIIYRMTQQTREQRLPESGPEQSPASIPASIDEDDRILPFKTCKPLQAAMYRRLQQRNRKSPGNTTATTRATTKDKKSGVLSRSRKVKREVESQSQETGPGVDIKDTIGCDGNGDIVKAGWPSGNKRKRKSFAVSRLK